jgi:hypothetical protein
MGICNLDQNKGLADSLANYLNISIKKSLKDNQPFKLVSVMRKVYDIAYKKDQDINKALGIAGAIPKLFLELLKMKPEYLSQLMDKGFKFDPIADFNKEIETSDKPLDVVSKYVLTDVAAPTVVNAIQNSTTATPTEKPIAKQSKDVPTFFDRVLLPDTFNTTTGFSGIRNANVNIIDRNDPAKINSYNALINLLLAQGDAINFEDVEYDGHKGFLLKVVKESLLPNPEKNVYSDDKLSMSLVVAVIDTKGNYLYFDQAGKITTEENGKIAYYALRNPKTKADVDKMVNAAVQQQTPIIGLQTQGDPEQFEVRMANFAKAKTKQFTDEMNNLAQIRRDVTAGDNVFFNITGGVVGHIDDRGANTPLSEIDPKMIESFGDDTTTYVSEGVSYTVPGVKFKNYPHIVPLKGSLVKEATPDLFKNLIDLLVDDLIKSDDKVVSPAEKIELFKQYVEIIKEGKKTKANKLLLSTNNDKLNIFIGNQLVSLEDKAAAKILLSNFLADNAYHTYIKTRTGSYNTFTIENNILSVKEDPAYKNFIMQYLVPRIMVDSTTKTPIINNGYFLFENINQEKIVAKETDEVLKKAEKEIKKTDVDTDDLADALERSKLIASRSNKIQKEIADQWIKDAAILKVKVNGQPVLSIEDARNITNSDAFATFARATMTLYKGGDSTHMYHEAWHAFSQVYLKRADRDKLYSDASKLDSSFTYVKKVAGPGGNTIQKVTVKLNSLNPNNKHDRKILEEFVAEEFRMFAMNNGKFKTENKKTSVFKDIFNKIWELLKALFKGTLPVNVYSNPGASGVFSEMFNALYNAKEASDLNMFMPSINNAEFGTLNTGIIDELSELDLDLISRSMDGLISAATTKLIKEGQELQEQREGANQDLDKDNPKLGAAMKIFGSQKALSALYNVTLKSALTKRLETLLAEKAINENKWNSIEKDYHVNYIRILTKALDNFGDINTVLNSKTKQNSVTAYHYKNSAFANRLKSSANEVMGRNDKGANDVESEKLATANAKYLIESLVQQDYNVNKSARIDRLNELGFPQTVEFKPVWNFLMNKIGGQQNEEDLFNKLQELKAKKVSPLIDQLLDKLGDPGKVMSANKVSADLWLGMVRSLNLTRLEFFTNNFTIKKDDEGKETLTSVSGKVSADYFNIKNNIWKNKFSLETSNFVFINDNKQNQLALDKIAEAFLTDGNNPKEWYLNSDRVIEYRLKKGQDPIAFLNAIGLYMSNDYEVRNAISPVVIDYIANAIGQAYFNELVITDPQQFLDNARSIKVKKFIGGKVIIEDKTPTGERYRLESNANRVNELALIEAENSTEYSNQMKPLADKDKKKSIYSLNSTASRIKYALNKVRNINELGDLLSNYGIVPQYVYAKNPTVMGSLFKNSLFDSLGNKRSNTELILHEMIGSQLTLPDGSVEGLAPGGMSANEKFLSDVQSLLSQGFMEAVRSGEKRTYLALRPNKIITAANYDKKSDHLFFDTEDFLVDSFGGSVTGMRVNDYLNDVMFKKLEGELRRIQKFNTGITEVEARSLDLIPEDASLAEINRICKNFYKTNVKNFDNGFKLDWFDEILESAQVSSKLKEDLITVYSADLNDDNNLKDLLISTEEGKALKKDIDAQIKLYFKGLADRFKEQYYSKIYGETIPDFLKNLVTKNLNEGQKNKVTNESAIDALMMSFAVNSAILSDEVILTLYGDGFQSNHSKDEFTKRVPTYHSPGIVFSTGVNSVNAINKFYPRLYEAKLIAEGLITERTSPRLFDKIGQKAIIRDSTVSASRIDEYHDLFKNTLSKRNYTAEEIDELLYGKGGSRTDFKKDSIMHSWANITDADGQGYITLDYYRMLKANENNWTDAQEALYQKELKGEYVSAKEISDAFPIYKLQHSGPIPIKGGVYPIQSIDKFALMPLIPSLIKGTRLERINLEMMRQGSDYLLFDSGAKRSYIMSGKSNGDDIFEGEDTSKLKQDIKFTINPFYVDFLKNQTEVNRELKGKSTLSTQFRKLFDVTLYENGMPVDYKGTKESWDALSKSDKQKASRIYKKTEAVLDELVRLTDYMRKDLLTELGWSEKPDGTLDGNLETMISYIKKKLEEQGYAKHEIDSIETDNGKIDLSTTPIAQRLEKFLFAIVNNRLVRLKIKGEPFVQASAAFFQKFDKPTDVQTKQYDDFGTTGTRGYVVDPNGIENTKGVRVKIALTKNYENLYNTKYFEGNKETDKIIAVYNADGSINHPESFKRLNEMVKNDSWLEHDNNRKKIQITGVRIPVQGANSTEFAEVWEFLPPSAGSIIIIPGEIVAKSGGDFDVDKLTMYIKHISSQGSLLTDTFKTPKDIDIKLKPLEAELERLKGGRLNIKNNLNDFRKSITDIQGYIEMSKEQIEAFTNNDDKELLETLKNPENQEYLKEVAKTPYKIYNDHIKSFDVKDYDEIAKMISALNGANTPLAKVYKQVSDLKEQKRFFTAGIQNSLVDNLIQVLELPEMAFSLLLPNGTYLTKPFADELQVILREVDKEVDYNKSVITGKSIEGRAKGINPGVLRDYSYNLKKQQDNIMGGSILGPIVLEIPVNNLLNKAGTLLNGTIPETISGFKKGKKFTMKVDTPVTLELKHNTLDEKTAVGIIKRISMSNILDADKKNQIADVLSQLANGAVDVGKDAWIAYLQGNLEAIPKILFLLETGVPAADVFYFVNNPLIREYVQTKRIAGSKLAAIFFGSTHSRFSKVNEYLNGVLAPIKLVNKAASENFDTLWGKYNLMQSFIKDVKVDAFDRETLQTVAKNQGTFDQKMAGLLQYLYVEQLTEYHDTLKGAIDVDNNTTGDNAEVQAKIEEIADARNIPIYDKQTLDYLQHESILSSFFIQELSADLFGERLFLLRANPNLDKFIRTLTKNNSAMYALKKNTGLNSETFPRKFKNAVMSYILTNTLNGYNPKINLYKGHEISSLLDENSPIKSIDQLVTDFNAKNYLASNLSNDGYRARGLQPINPGYLVNYTVNDFINLALEREYLRKYSLPFNDTLKESIEFKTVKQRLTKSAAKTIDNWTSLDELSKDKMIYEFMLLSEALLNTFNNAEMFISGENTVAKKLLNIIKNYPDLNYKYGNLLERFSLDALEPKIGENAGNVARRNFKLKANADITKPEAENYHKLWKELADPSKHKLSKSEPVDLAANKYISDFFAMLPTAAFLQSGMDPSKFSMNSVMPTEGFKEIMDDSSKVFVNKVLKDDKTANDVLSKIYYLFLANNNNMLFKLKGRGLSYKKPLIAGPDVDFSDRSVASDEKLDALEIAATNAVLAIQQAMKADEVRVTKTKLISDADLESFKKYMTNRKGVLPKEFFTSNTKFKEFYNEQTGKREGAPQVSKWILNSRNLYDLIDKETGELYLENVNLETGYQEGFVQEPIMEAAAQSSTNVDAATYTNYSGAAEGSDKEWANVGKEFGIGKQVDYTPQTLQKLSEAQRKEIEDAYQQAVQDLGRKSLQYNWSSPQKEDYSGGLVRRDYLQAKAADSVFAIGTIVNPGDKNKAGYAIKSKTQSVDGGTGYAVQMAINLGKPVYVFDQVKKAWYEWNGSIFVQTFTPTLTPKFAGVGTRELSEAGKQAIRDVYANTFKSAITQPQPVPIQVPASVQKKKDTMIKAIRDAIKNNQLAEVLAVIDGGYDVQDFITNLEAATTEDEVNKTINDLLKLIC